MFLLSCAVAVPCAFSSTGGSFVVGADGCLMEKQLVLNSPTTGFKLFNVGLQSWICPTAVITVYVVAVGGGAGGTNKGNFYGGGGGALIHGAMTVIPGEEYEVQVGKGGALQQDGGDSWFKKVGTNSWTSYGGKGNRGGGHSNTLPSFALAQAKDPGLRSRQGGNGGSGNGADGAGGAGGGAAGWSGNGGNGGSSAPVGGGGAGGSRCANDGNSNARSGGGGVGLLSEGTSGIVAPDNNKCGTDFCCYPNGGGGGSGGSPGGAGGPGAEGGKGGVYGGGGGGGYSGGGGGNGGVRLSWVVSSLPLNITGASSTTPSVINFLAATNPKASTDVPTRLFQVPQGQKLILSFLKITGNYGVWSGGDGVGNGNSGLGGALLIHGENAAAILISVTFDGIECSNSTPLLEKKCGYGGGAIAVLDGARVDISSSTFTNLRSGAGGGGAIFLNGNDDTTLSLLDTAFENNKAVDATTESGGAISVLGRCPKVSLTGMNRFKNNLPITIRQNNDDDDSDCPGHKNSAGASITFHAPCSPGTYQDSISVLKVGTDRNDFTGCPYACPVGKTTAFGQQSAGESKAVSSLMKWTYEWSTQVVNDASFSDTTIWESGKAGSEVEISGDTAVVSMGAQGQIAIYTRTNNNAFPWQSSIISGTGKSFAVSISENYIFANHYDGNMVWIFKKNSGSWPSGARSNLGGDEMQTIASPFNGFGRFGCAVANSDNFALVGACEQKKIFLFHRSQSDNGLWQIGAVADTIELRGCQGNTGYSREQYGLAINDNFAVVVNQGGRYGYESHATTAESLCIYARTQDFAESSNPAWALKLRSDVKGS